MAQVVLLHPPTFIDWVNRTKSALGDDLERFVLSADLEDKIVQAFFQGHLTGLVTHDTDSKGKIQMRLAGTPVMFTDSLDLGHALFVLKGGKTDEPTGANPVFPGTGGTPGSAPGGGTHMALAA